MGTTRKTLTLLSALAVLSASAAHGADELNVSAGYSIAGKPLALHGYDAVAYFTAARATRGSDKYVHVHDGAAYRFANQENLDTFKANPARYTPAYGGFCAFGVALGKKFDGDPTLWRIVRDRLYLNLNEEIQNKWSEDIGGNIRKANAQWKSVSSRPVSSL